MTMQSVFSHTLAFMRKQGRPSFTEDGSNCAYNGADGAHCGVACNAPGLDYTEHACFGEQFEEVREALCAMIPDCHNPEVFWEDLQRCHDTAGNSVTDERPFVRRFEIAMRNFAVNYGLEFV